MCSIIGAVALLPIAAGSYDWWMQIKRQRYVVARMPLEFPVGMEGMEAIRYAQQRYGLRPDPSGVECVEPLPYGGRCMHGVVRTGSTWWGLRFGVSFSLALHPDNEVSCVSVRPVYAFLDGVGSS